MSLVFEPHWLSPTERSVFAEVSLQANRYGSPLETVQLSGQSGRFGWMVLFERRMRGWRTGIHDGMLIMQPSFSPFNFCSEKVLAEVLGNRSVASLRVFGSGLENMASWDRLADRVALTSVREVMPLASDHKAFLGRLGKHTRRNLQQCRKWASAKGIRVQCEPLSAAEASELANHNMPTPKQPERMLQNIQYTAQQAQPFQLSLISDRGVPFSTVGGYVQDKFAFMIYQANDHRYRDLNPSLMLRGFLIEQLIEQGVNYLAFVGGCAGVLLHQCEVVPTGELLLVRKSIVAGLKHLAAASFTDATNRVVRLMPEFV